MQKSQPAAPKPHDVPALDADAVAHLSSSVHTTIAIASGSVAAQLPKDVYELPVVAAADVYVRGSLPCPKFIACVRMLAVTFSGSFPQRYWR